MIFDAIAGLYAETVAVMMMHLGPGHGRSIDHIEQVLDTVFAMVTFTFPIATNYHHGAGHRAIDATMQVVGGLIATSTIAHTWMLTLGTLAVVR